MSQRQTIISEVSNCQAPLVVPLVLSVSAGAETKPNKTISSKQLSFLSFRQKSIRNPCVGYD